jgi:hypothetical protein
MLMVESGYWVGWMAGKGENRTLRGEIVSFF